MRDSRVLILAACLAFASMTGAQADGPSPGTSSPRVTGTWTGMWWTHPPTRTPPQPAGEVRKQQLDCTVLQKENLWQATFEGECGRPYKFTIKMDGRQAGEAVMFKGTADLGEADGGVFDWIGRATDHEFAGFFTSAKYAGEFRLERQQTTAVDAVDRRDP
jgi:hypothetical protein